MREDLTKLVEEWESMAKGVTQFDAALRVAALKVREVLDTHPERQTDTEWAAGFADNGEVYNIYRSQREAESYVRSMNEVGAKMVVLTRRYTPSVQTAWAPFE
jgi:hypothetical protein